jgi:hypothetical protein
MNLTKRTQLTRIHVVVPLLVAWCMGATAIAQKTATSIPFTRSKDGQLMVPGSAGAGTQYSFVLDTGAGLSVLPKSVVEKLGGKPTGHFTGFRETGERLELDLYTIPELRVGPAVQSPAIVVAWDALDKFHLDGIISLAFFRKQPITLDFVHDQLTFETPASLALRRRSGSAVPVRLDASMINATSASTCSRHSSLARFRLNVRWDTGSEGYMVQQRYMGSLAISPESSAVKKSEHTTILGNKEVRYGASLPSLTLGGVPPSSRPNLAARGASLDA